MIVDANEPEETKEEKPYRVVNEEGEMRDLPTSSIHTNSKLSIIVFTDVDLLST